MPCPGLQPSITNTNHDSVHWTWSWSKGRYSTLKSPPNVLSIEDPVINAHPDIQIRDPSNFLMGYGSYPKSPPVRGSDNLP